MVFRVELSTKVSGPQPFCMENYCVSFDAVFFCRSERAICAPCMQQQLDGAVVGGRIAVHCFVIRIGEFLDEESEKFLFKVLRVQDLL